MRPVLAHFCKKSLTLLMDRPLFSLKPDIVVLNSCLSKDESAELCTPLGVEVDQLDFCRHFRINLLRRISIEKFRTVSSKVSLIYVEAASTSAKVFVHGNLCQKFLTLRCSSKNQLAVLCLTATPTYLHT